MASRAVSVNGHLKRGVEFPLLERLGQVVRSLNQGIVGVCGQEHHRDVSKLGGGLDTVERPSQMDIHEDRVRTRLWDFLYGHLAARRPAADLVTLMDQPVGEMHGDERLVFNDVEAAFVHEAERVPGFIGPGA